MSGLETIERQQLYAGGRPTLVDVIAAHRRFGMRCTCAWGPLDWSRTFADQHDQHVADFVREHILGLLADETLVERCAEALLADLEASIREDVRAVLAQVAEAVRRG